MPSLNVKADVQDDLRAKLETTLQKVSHELGLSIELGAWDYSLQEGLSLSNMTVEFKESDRKGFKQTFPKIYFEMEMMTSPSFHLALSGVRFEYPVIQVRGYSLEEFQNLVKSFSEKLKNKIRTENKASSSEKSSWVKAAENFKFNFEKAQLIYQDISFGDQKISGELSHLSSVFTLNRKTKQLHGQGDFQDEIRFEIFSTQTEYQGKVLLNGVKLVHYQKNLPEFFKIYDESLANGEIHIQFPKNDLSAFSLTFNLALRAFAFNHWRLAPEPVIFSELKLAGRSAIRVKEKRLELDAVKVSFGELSSEFSAAVEYGKNKTVQLNWIQPPVAIQGLLRSLPVAFTPYLQGALVQGDVSCVLDLNLDLDHPRRLVFDPQISIDGFQLIRSPLKADFERLKGEFTHVVKNRWDKGLEIIVGPSNRSFVSFRNLGTNVKRAILTSEDGRFFRHNGFSLKHIQDSIADNVIKKRFARGASTITMQLAKNLFLDGEKNIARKFQEILLAYTLEQELDKDRLFEIYMNIIEWGPKIYGVGKASHHYFYKSPSKLTVLEAAYLGSIISNPKKYYYMFRRGELSDHWKTYVVLIASKMGVELGGGSLSIDDLEFGWVKKKRLKEEKEVSLVSEKTKK